jgi:hypothetical protein
MAKDKDAVAVWLPVIGKSLAHMCLRAARKDEPSKFDSVLKRVQFLEALGLDRVQAAEAAGSSAESVRVLRHLTKRGRAKNGKAKTKRTG